MEPILLIIIVWSLLAAAMIGFVVYRLFTDRRKEGEKHFMYPIVSKPTDGMFPTSPGKLDIISYLLISIGMLAFIALIVIDSFVSKASIYLINGAGISITLGVIILGIGKFIKYGHK